MKNIHCIVLGLLLFLSGSIFGQKADTTDKKKEKIKEEWSLGTILVVAFEQDIGWKFLKTVIWNQNIYLALNTFTDLGMVTGKYEIDKSGVPDEYLFMFPDEKEKPHISYGLGLHIALNQNFVVATNFGFAADERDGKTALYINLNGLS